MSSSHHSQPEKLFFQAAYTLLEITIIVLILGILAAIVVPNFSASNPKKLDLVAYNVAEALRYARSEALRSGEIHGVLIDTNNSDSQAKDISVFIPDLSGNPFGILQILNHPLNKQAYDFFLEKIPLAGGVKFASSTEPFSFAGISGTRKYLFFNKNGVPVWLENSVLSRFTGGDIQLQYSDLTRTISIQPVTGKVTVQ